MIEKWSSVEELDEHGSGEAVHAQTAALEGLLASPVEVTRLVPLPAGSAEQGQL
jgi:quinol monooxygenase YgiN